MNTRTLALSASLLSIVTACGSEDDVDTAGAQRLWEQIQAEQYESWDRAPGWEAPQPTVSAHGATAEIFINAVMVEALAANAASWPAGALVVKNSYRSEALSLVAAMEKRDNGWYFAEWDGAGSVKYGGTPDVCTDCHGTGDDAVLSLR